MSKKFCNILVRDSCLTKAEEPSLSYYLPIAEGRIIGFIRFPRVLVLCYVYHLNEAVQVVISTRCGWSYEDSLFGSVSLFNGISTCVGYLMPKLFS